MKRGPGVDDDVTVCDPEPEPIDDGTVVCEP